jgi:hypothetical protein
MLCDGGGLGLSDQANRRRTVSAPAPGPGGHAYVREAMNYALTFELLFYRGEGPARMLTREPSTDLEFLVVRRWVVGYAMNVDRTTPEA